MLATRKAFQNTMRHNLVSGVEEILGRRVTAFFSDNNIEPDMAAETFVLAPPGAEAQGNGSADAATRASEATAGA